MSEREPTCIARVSHVMGAVITARLDPDLAGVAPLWQGRLQPIGQVGSIVAIPQGPIRLLATVVLVGLSELSGSLPPVETVQAGDRWLRLQLLGEVDALGNFQRGVSTYPGLDDPVHFIEPDLLSTIHPRPDKDNVAIGRLASSLDVEIALNAKYLVTRHSIVVGSTGSGKTSCVATIIQSFVSTDWPAANIVVIDPHGEYISALGLGASVRSVSDADTATMLRVPFWALPAQDILTALSGSSTPTATVLSKFSELVAAARIEYASRASWINSTDDITADTPIPFDINKVWYDLDFENRKTLSTTAGQVPCIISPGSSDELVPATFTPHGPGGAAPFKGSCFGYYGNTPERIRTRLQDARFSFFLKPGHEILDHDPLIEVIHEWLGSERAVSVLDFAGVPVEIADLAIGVILQLLFEVSIRSNETKGIGRHRPTLVVLEEAHRYLGEDQRTRIAQESVNRIAREGRKYGIGLMLVTQRPSELPDTALSQAGTVIALRLTNAADQSRVRAGLPDSLEGLAEALPSLRTGEAIVAGEAVHLPSRILINRPDPEPHADDPSLERWQGKPGINDVQEALALWRGVQAAEGDIND